MSYRETSRSVKDYTLLVLRGVAMGAADVVPGVSGGTVAFITGIYQELLNSIRSMNPKALQLLFNEGLSSAWRHINGNFLLAVFAGIGVSLFSLAHLIDSALTRYPILVWSFFFGLVLASVWHVMKQVLPLRVKEVAWLVIGLLLAWGVTEVRPTELPGVWWLVLPSGALAVCAMILPGISGSFILLLLGMYRVVLDAVQSVDVLLLGSFLVGCVLGLLLFSHVLGWLLEHYFRVTLSLLTGFLLGSLSVIWPWKQVVETTMNRHGELVPLVQENILPTTYANLNQAPSQWLAALGLALAGALIVLALEKLPNE